MSAEVSTGLDQAAVTEPYRIEKHAHLFAVWAASRAASVKGCRISVAQGRAILESCGFVADLSTPDQLPDAANIDDEHRAWRETASKLAFAKGGSLTHGVAAKLINIYLKSRFVCAGYSSHERVAALHPPIDKLLLEELAHKNLEGHARVWRKASRDGWSKMNSDEYERLISLIRDCLHGQPLWMIEEYWRGNQ